MGRSPCCDKEGVNRGAWTPLEDKILTDYIKSYGEGKWRSLPKRAGLKRCGKSCRLRWLNYLRPDIKRGNITKDEEDLIIRLHKLLGNRWSLIAGRLPGRTDNEIKNYWNTNLHKKLVEGCHARANSTSKSKPPSTTRSRLAVPNSSTYKQPMMKPPNSDNVGSSSNNSHVVRTKARRCNKVFINADLHHDPNIIAPTAPTSGSDADADADPPSASGGISATSPTSSSFMMDIEMDDKFLSDFLNTDFAAFADDFDQAGGANDFYPNDSGHNALLLDDHSDLGMMESLLDPAMEWLNGDEKKLSS